MAATEANGVPEYCSGTVSVSVTGGAGAASLRPLLPHDNITAHNTPAKTQELRLRYPLFIISRNVCYVNRSQS